MNYYDNSALSQSMLKELKKSPAHFHAKYIAKIVPQEESAALIFGNVVHTLLLQPEIFVDKYIVAEDVNRTTKEGKAYWNKLVESNPDKIIIKSKEHVQAIRMAEAIMKKPASQLLFNYKSVIEKEFYFIDNEFEIECKIKPDLYIEPCEQFPSGIIVDLKTTENASHKAFTNSIWKYGYHNQAAFYAKSLKQIYSTPNDPTVILIPVEKIAPWECCFYNVDDAMLEAGYIENGRLLTLYKECLTNNNWHGYSDEIQSISLPYWAFKEIDNDN